MGQQENILTAQSILLFISYLSAIYLNIYVLIPRFLLTRKYLLYVLFFILVIVCLFVVIDIPELVADKKKLNVATQIPAIIFLYTICIAGSSMPVLFRHWVRSEKQMSDLKQTTVKNELEHLKTQIHPAFLFKVLDDAIILTKEAPEQASATLMKLSKLLRYQLYDSVRERVLLSAEITFLTNFLELKKSRKNGNDFTLSISEEGNINHVLIPPLLLTPLVNHIVDEIGSSKEETSVYLTFHIEGNLFQFSCIGTNHVTENRNRLDLSNVRRRLELLFRDSYTLDFINDKTNYGIKLSFSIL